MHNRPPPLVSRVEQMFDNFTRGFRDPSPIQRDILRQLTALTLKVEKLMIDVSKIQAAVDRSKAGVDSVLALLSSLVAQVKDLSAQLATAIAAADPAAQQVVQEQLDKLANDLNAESDAIAAATAAPPA